LEEVRQAELFTAQDAHSGRARFTPRDIVPVLALGYWGQQLLEGLISYWEAQGLKAEELPFLWVDVALPGERADKLRQEALSIADRQKIVLDPPWEELLDIVRQEELRPAFRWLPEDGKAGQRELTPRHLARLAFYWDVMQGSISRLREGLRHLKTHEPRLRVLAAIWEQPSVSFLADLAALYYRIDASERGRVELWLLAPSASYERKKKRSINRSKVRFIEAEQRDAFIAHLFWELARFQHRRSEPFTFSFSPAHSVYLREQRVLLHHALFERIYYFEGPQGEEHIKDGLRILVGPAQEQYQKRLQNYYKDWPRSDKPAYIDGLLTSVGAVLRSAGWQDWERALSQALLAVLLYGPGGLYPWPKGLFLPLPFHEGFHPQAQPEMVEKLKADIQSVLNAAQGPPDFQTYNQIARLLRDHLNRVPEPLLQRNPWLEVVEALRQLVDSGQLAIEVEQSLAELYRALNERGKALEQLYRQLHTSWRQAWRALKPEQQQPLRERYEKLLRPLQGSLEQLRTTWWYRIRKRGAWGLVPEQVIAGRSYWRVGFVRLPTDLKRLDRWMEYWEERPERMVAHWRHYLLNMTQSELPDVKDAFYEYVREHFAALRPTLQISKSRFTVPNFHRLALVVGPKSEVLDKLGEYFKHEAPERYPEFLSVTLQSLRGFGALLHEEPFLMMDYPALELGKKPIQWVPTNFVYRGEQLAAWGWDFPHPDVWHGDWRTRLENHEAWLLPLVKGWVLLLAQGFPPTPREAERAPDEEAEAVPPSASSADEDEAAWLDEIKAILGWQDVQPGESAAESPAAAQLSPERLLDNPQGFPPLDRYLRWWQEAIHPVFSPNEAQPDEAMPRVPEQRQDDAQDLEEILQEWAQEAPERLREYAARVLTSLYPQARKGRRQKRWERKFLRLDPSLQEALLWLYLAARLLQGA